MSVFMTPPSWENWINNVLPRRIAGESHYFPKTDHCCLPTVHETSHDVRKLLEECFMDGWNQNRTFWFEWIHTYAFLLKNFIPSVKHGGGNTMVWPALLPLYQEKVAIIVGTMNSELYQQILQEYIRVSVQRAEAQEKRGQATRQSSKAHVTWPKND